MKSQLQLWHLLLLILAGWINRRQQDAVGTWRYSSDLTISLMVSTSFEVS